jgi:hypothetical protein
VPMAGALRFEMISDGTKGINAGAASIRGQRRLRSKTRFRR